MAKQGCIMCGKEVGGLAVQEDWVIRFVRGFKTHVTRNARNYKLVVCRECYNNYHRMRKRFVRNRILYTGFGIAFLVVFALVSGLVGIAVGLVVTVLMYLLSLLSYAPAVDEPQEPGPAGKPRARTGARSKVSKG